MTSKGRPVFIIAISNEKTMATVVHNEVHNEVSMQDLQLAMLRWFVYARGDNPNSLYLPLNDSVSVLCKCGNQPTLCRVVNAKRANPNQFITLIANTTQKPVIYL